MVFHKFYDIFEIGLKGFYQVERVLSEFRIGVRNEDFTRNGLQGLIVDLVGSTRLLV